MAAVSVFVDEAVRGRLPMVCARTGQPADLMVRTTRPVGGGLGGVAWLLVFLGPPGWLALIVVWVLSPGQEQLTVRLPRTSASYASERQLRRSTWIAFLLGAAALTLALATAQLTLAAQAPAGQPRLWLALGVLLIAGALVLHGREYFNGVGVSLDASRRWVTLTGVHPDFVRAVERHETEIRRS
ncbi:MAG: hypothetical protein M3066_00215 [Actinomycetota bacterium]|nr:hypothetical protein [Actinomycetota bacterium]